MKKAKKAVAAVFPSDDQARVTLARLIDFGVQEKNILAFPYDVEATELRKDSNQSPEIYPRGLGVVAISSAISGGVGSLMGGLTSLGALGSLGNLALLGETYPFAALAGVALGSTIGGLSGWYYGISCCNDQGPQCESSVHHKIYLVVKVAPFKAEEIKHIYEEAGAEKISVAPGRATVSVIPRL